MCNKIEHAVVITLTAVLLAACGPTATPQPASPTAAPVTDQADPTAVVTEVEATATPRQERPFEAIAIQQPASSSIVASPLQVRGMADPTFEQNLGLRLYRMTGELLAEGSATIEAPIGERGPFSGELTFEAEPGGPLLLQVFNTSARDGGLTHLSSVPLTLSEQGEVQIKEAPVGPEQIFIEQPEAGATLSGGLVRVSGFGRASFEATLVVEVVNADGETVGQQPLIVEEPAMGEPGHFMAEVNYDIDRAQPGRLVVYDPSPAFGGLIHLNSVEVQLQP